MCTNPITITRKDPCSNSTKTYIVPCGKCAECTKKKQSEFAALSLHQALKRGQLHFFTFTYRPETLPIAISDETCDGPRFVGFQRGEAAILEYPGAPFLNHVVHVLSDCNEGYFNCASLCREDVKKVLKQFRKDNPDAKFKYAIFGEYGEHRGRPHYHGLFYGLTCEQACKLSKLWSERFGYVHYAPVENRPLELSELVAMSKYASKYISKGTYTRWKDILPYVEKPRRQSSLNFGDFDENELAALSSFMMGAMFPEGDFQQMNIWLSSRLDASLSKLLDKVSLSPNV